MSEHHPQEVSMAGWQMANTTIRHAAWALLLAGGLVLGVSSPSLAATTLGSKPGVSCGCSDPPEPHPRAVSNSGGHSVTPDGEVVALGSTAGVSRGIGCEDPYLRPV
jgi:hypothetical protein